LEFKLQLEQIHTEKPIYSPSARSAAPSAPVICGSIAVITSHSRACWQRPAHSRRERHTAREDQRRTHPSTQQRHHPPRDRLLHAGGDVRGGAAVASRPMISVSANTTHMLLIAAG